MFFSSLLRGGLYPLLLLVLVRTMAAQHIVSRNYLLKDGLPSTETYNIISDREGFLWIATDAGLCRFDGYRFKIFSIRDGLPESTVLKLYEDRKGRIWFSTLTSKLGYVYNDAVVVLHLNPEVFSDSFRLRRAHPVSFYMDEGDTMWVGTSESGRVLKIPPPYSFPSSCIRQEKNSIMHPGKGSCIFSTCNSLVFQETDSRNTSAVKHSYPLHTIQGSLKLVAHHPSGAHFASIEKNVFLLQHGQARLIKSFNNQILSLWCDDAGYLWAGLRSEGAYCFKDPLHSNASRQVLADYSVTSIAKDLEHSHWFSTLEQGIIYMPRMSFERMGNTSDFLNKRITGILIPSADSILVQAFSERLYIYKKGTITSVMTGASNPLYTFTDFPGKVFFSAPDPGYLDIPANTLHRIVSKEKKIWYLKHFASDGKGNLYASYPTAITRLDKDHGFRHSVFLAPQTRINHFIIDQQGVFWIATTNGLVSYDGKNPPYFWSRQDPHLGKRLDMILEDRYGQLWLASRGNGLFLFDKKKITRIIDEQAGLSSDFCRTLFTDASKTIWVGTNGGLSRIDPVRFTVNNYSFLNELIPGEINDIKRFRDDLWLATSSGAFRFSVQELEGLQVNPPVFITNVSSMFRPKINNQAVLDHSENFLRFSFLGLSYFNAGKITYSFKLDGVDANWRTTINPSNFTEYSLLAPGKYCFRVRARIDAGENMQQAVFRFTILPPFWRTYWFTGLSLISGFILLYLIYQIRISKIKKIATWNMTISKLEVKALRAQMNPHFIFNAIASIQKFILKNEKRPAYDFLTKFARLIRNVLENSKHDSISLANEIETLDLYIQLEQLRAANRFTYTIRVEPGILPDRCFIPSMIIQPFVENAIIHGLLPKPGPGLLSVLIWCENNRLHCVIEDNGIGRKASAERKKKEAGYHQSMGMDVTFERLNLLAKVNHSKASYIIQDQYDSEGHPSGTRILLQFPLEQRNPAGI